LGALGTLFLYGDRLGLVSSHPLKVYVTMADSLMGQLLLHILFQWQVTIKRNYLILQW